MCKLQICGNVKADNLARLALEQGDSLHKDKTLVRKEILVQSAQLVI
jgi:fructose-specific component phosphotransferase system IIB-like protein